MRPQNESHISVLDAILRRTLKDFNHDTSQGGGVYVPAGAISGNSMMRYPNRDEYDINPGRAALRMVLFFGGRVPYASNSKPYSNPKPFTLPSGSRVPSGPQATTTTNKPQAKKCGWGLAWGAGTRVIFHKPKEGTSSRQGKKCGKGSGKEATKSEETTSHQRDGSGQCATGLPCGGHSEG